MKDPHYGSCDSGYPKPIKGAWGIPDSWAEEGIDAIASDHYQKEYYFFKGDEYVMVKMEADTERQPGYPKKIDGASFKGIDQVPDSELA